MALRSVTDRHKVQELTEENTRLRSQVPSMKKRLEEAQRQQRLEQEKRRLRDENYYLQSELQEERSFTERLTDGIGRMLDFLEEHLPERLRPLLEKVRSCCPIRRLDSSRATAAPARNGRHGAVKEACPEGLKISFGQAIITTENRELLY